MADPRIRYDIEASVSGGPGVEVLASQLERLDEAIDPAATARAQQLAAQLRELGQQQQAIDTFVELKGKTGAARTALDEAQGAAQRLAKEISAAGAPTRAQAGQMERLRDAVKNAKDELQTQTAALDASRAGLSQLGLSSTDLASAQRRLRDSFSESTEEAAKLARQSQDLKDFRQLVAATDEARDRFQAADAAVEKFRRSLDGTRTPSSQQVQELQRLQQAARQAQQAFAASSDAQVQAAGRLRATGVDTERLATLQGRLPPALTATATAARQLGTEYTRTGAAAQASGATQARAATAAREGIAGLAEDLRRVQSVAALGIGGGVLGTLARDLTQTADAYQNLAARVKLATGEGQSFERTMEGVFDVALRTNSSVEETANLFSKLTLAGKELKLSQADALSLTETINQAIQLSGGSADSAKAAIVQLVQGLQSGVLRGDEFNSVMEQSPRLAKALADGLGVTVGQLREMAKAGALSTEVIVRALQAQKSAIESEFKLLPATVGRALQNLSTAWTQYIGQADSAAGVSAFAAKSINLVAQNLGTLASAAASAGQAYLAYKALDLAGTWANQAVAARALLAAKAQETAATTAGTVAANANTTAVAANTAAKLANARASGVAAAAESAAAAAGGTSLLARLAVVGRFAGALGAAGAAAVAFGDLAVSAYRKVYDAVGAGLGRLMGYRDVGDELPAIFKRVDEEARKSAEAIAEHAAKTKLAEEKAFGFTEASRRLVGEFDNVVKAGGSAEVALDKVQKSLQLGDVQGITAAAVALDNLGQRGVVNGAQLREALSAALKNEDLGLFEARARAAFDGSAQGVRRLQLALDAVGEEALRRAGTSLAELGSGFSAAAQAALNDVDALARTLDTLKLSADRTSPVLAKAIDKALEAATTEKAVNEVIARLRTLGEQGKISGEAMAAGLEKARGKLDEILPGVTSLAEAYKVLGVTSRAELQRTADTSRQAWERIRTDATLSLDQKRQAFSKYAEAAIAANGGVATSSLEAEAKMLGLGIQADETGKAIVTGMGKASASTRDLARNAEAAGKALEDTYKTWEQRNAARNKAVSDSAIQDTFANLLAGKKSGEVTRESGGQLVPPDGKSPESSDYFLDTSRRGEGPYGLGVWTLKPEAYAKMMAEQDARYGVQRDPVTGVVRRVVQSPAPAPAQQQLQPITINLGGSSVRVYTDSQSETDKLLALLKDGMRAAGGGG